MMKILNYALLTILFVSIFACNSGSTNADSVESAKSVDGQHKATIKEIVPTSAYTYLSVNENSETFWIACPKEDFSVGQTIYFMTGMPMENFESKELGRTFDKVYLVNQVSSDPNTLNAAPQMMNATPHGMIQNAEKKDIKIEKVEGGVSIGELFSNPETYKGKEVMVKGEVVKYNPAIMGQNWVHVQDGTGKDESFDLTITTTDEVKVGDVVVFKGTISLNKDFGAGYVYAVIMENATLVTK